MPAVSLGLLLALTILAGCRDAPAFERAKDRRLTVVQTDYRYAPQRARASAGRLTLTVVNRARLSHTLRIEREGRTHLRVASQLPGERTRATVRLRRGTYKMLCAIGNHEELGMWGTLVVR